ncbi:phosphotransferase enzyme family protein [Streptomyces sp. NPDC001401]|uniref:phosphotransferase enzyme family protein n=1 Tax=Streptomyces sp. NPDC001401 TaxID=3364570 RepID=UPI00368F02A1
MRNAVDHLVEVYGLGAGPWTMTPVTRGALGQIWKLSGRSSTWAVKEMLFGCDEHQVQREAALREASERLGIASPKLLANRDGAHVSWLPPRLGGSSVKLYEWVDGAGADPARPEILSWVGRTLALLHVAGEGASEAPSSWYETCPQEADWEELHQRTGAAGLPWSDALARFAAGPAGELARLVTAADRSALVTSHLDVQPQNVLLGPEGPVLIDWDNAGPTAPERELAWIVFAWSGRNRLNADSARRVVRAYLEAGGPGRIRGLDAFSTLVATSLNYIQVQAEAAVDPAKTLEQREFGETEVARSLRNLPEPAMLSRLIKELEREWP